MSINNRSHWPTVSFGQIRLWDCGIRWSQINTSRGYYNWAALDAWVSLGQSKGKDLIYTFGSTPVWASTNKYKTGCAYGNGTCAPPNWTDWEEFVGRLVQRYKGRIKYYELWNEPNDLHYWTGSVSQMVELSRRAANLIRSIDSNAVILSPAPTWAATTAWAWLDSYLAAGGGNYFNITAIHAYSGNSNAESGFSIIDNVKSVMSKRGISRQIWITEGGWGRNSLISNHDTRAGFLAQRLLLTFSRGGVYRYYWYQWDNPGWGSLWTSTGGTSIAGKAFGQLYSWMVGNTMTSRCTKNSTTHTWTCGFTRPDGSKTMAVWNASSRSFSVPSGYYKYKTLSGSTYSVSGSRTVTIGYKPILLTQY